jgi:hypothetical protein
MAPAAMLGGRTRAGLQVRVRWKQFEMAQRTGMAQLQLLHSLNPLLQVRAQASSTLVLPATPELVIPKYCESIHQTRRRPTRTVMVSGSGLLHSRSKEPDAREDATGIKLGCCVCADWQCARGQQAPCGTADYDHYRHPQCPGNCRPGGQDMGQKHV